MNYTPKEAIGKPVLLVVENDILTRMNIVHVAQDAGFEILEAGNADEAIEILEGRDDIRAIFTSVRMPGSMDGLRLANTISSRWPSIQMLVTSSLNVSNHMYFPMNGRFIHKPYENEQIAAALRGVLGAE
jgi:CheY-like chemotaxis protein